MSSGEGVHVFLKFQYLVLSKCVWPIGRSVKLTGSRIQIGQLDSGASSVAAGQCEKSLPFNPVQWSIFAMFPLYDGFFD
jgi:hypothetical protein